MLKRLGMVGDKKDTRKILDGIIVPSARWNLLPPVTHTRRAYTAT